MENVTIEVTASGVIVSQKKLTNSRLYMTAAGLNIWKIGAVTKARKDDVFWHAQNECTIRHIPLVTLRKVSCGCGKRKTARISDPFLANLFDTLTDEENGQMAHECSMCGKYTSYVDELGHCSSCRQVWEG